MTESHVDAAVQARIAAARAKVAAAKERRESLAEARRAGLARRHARKLRNLAAAEQRQDDDLEEDTVIPHPHRQKGGAPQLGAKGPDQTGPFGDWPDEDAVDEDDAQDLDQPERRLHMAQDS